MTSERINKFIADSGLMSRRKADEAILSGDIEINGEVVKTLGIKIDSEKDIVKYKGNLVTIDSADFVYYALYKPKGVISTAQDEKSRKTVTDLVPAAPRVYPVGRLDRDSEGLILLTNDGALANELSHPSFEHRKEYFVVAKNVKKISTDTIRSLFVKGLTISGKKMKADTVEASIAENTLIEIKLTLHTGYNRQIRKMCDKIGLVVIKLVRTGISKLSLEELKLKPGDYKQISKEQIV